ncbi:hypothetical protein TRFO_20737 [Tritrichomonas foetus]|uniref:Uncharacterized protein n=1 Tax=Tritrichomonas foetus TaxID=1144522 RepID=A0A1J4KF86_9EUKA|nr:hypothetical protein TRFO_20737 [Tritrichomonas foetus]|eukprot:OHT10103.1 hypothetical protein TRFO_20737 [Tritrichomonas foetus]
MICEVKMNGRKNFEMLLNHTILSLTLSGILSSPLLAGKSSVSLLRSSFSHSFSHVSYNTLHKLNIGACSFHQFRKSVVFTEGVPWNFTGYQKGRMKVQPEGNEVIEIWDAFFEDCIVEERGAAIFHYIPAWSGTCNVTRSSFIRCQTEDQGGAIFFVGHDFLMDSCFGFNCSAIFGQFIYTFLYEYESQMNAVNYTSTLYCSMDNETGKDSGLKLWYGSPKVFELNTTRNYVAWESAAVYLHSSDISNTSVYFCTFSSCSGSSMIHAKLQVKADFHCCSYINNTLTDNDVGHIDFENHVEMYKCVFLQNHGDRLFFQRNNGTLLLTKCKFDVPDGKWIGVTAEECKFDLEKPKTPCNDHLSTFGIEGNELCPNQQDKKDLLLGLFDYRRLYLDGLPKKKK